MFKTNVGADLKDKVEQNGDEVAAVLSDVADRVAGLNGKIEEQVDSALAHARKAGTSVNAYAKENPWQFAGLALALGFMAGWLVKKKS